MEIRNIPTGTKEFMKICKYVEENINRENLHKNGGTLNYSNLTYDSDILFIAYDNETPVGYNSIVRYEDGFYVYQIAVKKEYQGKGIGTAMLKEAIEIAEKENTFITAHVMYYNIPSQKMFTKQGFKKIKENDEGNGFYIRTQKTITKGTEK